MIKYKKVVSSSYNQSQEYRRILSSWSDDPEEDLIDSVFTEVLEELDIFEEPSTLGGDGTDFFYDSAGNELGSMDLDQEELELQNIYDESSSRADFKRKVRRWLMDICGMTRDPRRWRHPETYEKGLVISDGAAECLTAGAKKLGYEVNIPQGPGHGIIEFYKDGELVIELDTLSYGYALREVYRQSRTKQNCINDYMDYLNIVESHV